MAKLALLGGQRVFEQPLSRAAMWPPVDAETCQKLVELYYSRKWSAFDDLEGGFAQTFATYHGAEHGIFMINGTVTMQCALGAYGIGPGDEVIVPALTWLATAMAARYLGATPVFVDIDRETLCIDPDKIEAAITARTKAIMPVHLYSSMADMDRIMEIARRHDLRVVEDCAHVHGGIWGGKGIGTLGDVGSFSFQHGKTISSGEGGICITNDANIADRIFRQKHIGYGKNQHAGAPTNSPPADLICHQFRATTFQSLLVNEQLKTLAERLERYERNARYLESRLAQSTRIRFQKRGRRADRQGRFGWAMIFDDPSYAGVSVPIMLKALAAEGVEAAPTWGPVHRQLLFNCNPKEYRIAGDLAVTEHTTDRLVWLLHCFLGIEADKLDLLAQAIEKVANNIDELRRHAA